MGRILEDQLINVYQTTKLVLDWSKLKELQTTNEMLF